MFEDDMVLEEDQLVLAEEDQSTGLEFGAGRLFRPVAESCVVEVGGPTCDGWRE